MRLIKSPLEVALMARAAEANAAALVAVAQAARAGARHCELQALFAQEAAERGNAALFLNVDRVSSELSRGELARRPGAVPRRGEQLPALSRRFRADRVHRRTAPCRQARRGSGGLRLACRARDSCARGCAIREIVALGQRGPAQGRLDVHIGFGPHSVGLAHTDEPGELHGGFWRKPDIVLEEGMVISVDCPVLDTGIGGSAHCEDLMLITADGAECIHARA